MRIAGHVATWLGFLGGAFFSVVASDSVPWIPYGVCAAVLLLGIVLLRITAKQGASDEGKLDGDIDGLRDKMTTMVATLDLMAALGDDMQVYEIHERIDDELGEDLASFADARESMIPRFGLEAYAEVMTRFAAAERLINRAWSASADGYIDEVQKCLRDASALMKQAQDSFEARYRPSA